MSGRERLRAALRGDALAFAPIVWEGLPVLVHQERADWWRDPTTGQRLIADAAALAGADAMFTFVAQEAVRSAVAEGARGESGLDALAAGAAAHSGVELVRCLGEVAAHGVIAAVPSPQQLQHEFSDDQPEAAQDAFSDLVSAYLRAGADAVAVTGDQDSEVSAGVTRAAIIAGLFGRPVLGICSRDGETRAWDEHGARLGVISAAGEWPARPAGVVITNGDVSTGWDAARLRTVATARPVAVTGR